MKNTNTAASPELVHTVSGVTGDELQSTTALTAVTGGKGTAKVSNIFEAESRKRHAALAAKLQETQKARQLLAEAADLAKEGGDKSAEASAKASEAGVLLAVSMINGRMDRDEFTTTMGEYFGFRRKGDAKVRVDAGAKDASKTPFGVGEEIRKRAFRLLKASEYVKSDENGDRFFAGDEAAKVPALDPGDVESVVTAVTEGKLSFWSSYDKFAELRRDANDGRETSPAFNLRVIGNIRAGLAENVNAARDMIVNDPALLAGYVALQDVLNIIWNPTAPATEAKH